MRSHARPSVSELPPRWSAVLRALREARAVSQEGWAAQLGVGTRTVQRWEQGRAAPDAAAEAALLAYCEAKGLFRPYADGPLAGVTLTPAWLRDLLIAGRLHASGASRRPTLALIAPRTEEALVDPIPVPLTSLIGRDAEVDAIVERLRATRLVTLTGPGGVGKTRIALAVAERSRDAFVDGVAFVDLSAITDPGLVVVTIGRTLGVRESERRTLIEALRAYLRDKRILLVLDNFEQVATAAPLVQGLVGGAASLAALVTSRVVLHIAGEQEYPVPPLPYPDPETPRVAGELAGNPAVRLFVERAQAARPDFRLTDENAPTVAAICRRLDGMPLALELAAARIRLLTPQAMLARLDHSLHLLTGGGRGVPERQRTLRATLQWSHDLLDPEAQALFRRLAVFAGGWTLEAAEAICAVDDDIDVLDGLATLVEHSLVRSQEDPDGEPRFVMLATIGELALEHLVAGDEVETIRARHARYMVRLVEEVEKALQGAALVAALHRLDAEIDNLRNALRWAVDSGEDEVAARLLGAPEWFWFVRGHWHEARRWCAEVLALPGMARFPALRARLLWTSGFLGVQQGDLELARSQADEAVAVARASGDPLVVAWALYRLAWVTLMSGDLAAAQSSSAEAAARGRAAGHHRLLGYALNVGGLVAQRQGDAAGARAALEEALGLAGACGDIWHATMVKSNLANLAYREGDRNAARHAYEEVVRAVRKMGDVRHLALNLGFLARLLVQEGETERAEALAAESLGLSARVGALGMMPVALEVVALVSLRRGEPERAARLLGAAERLRETQALPAAAQIRDLPQAIERELAAVLGDARSASLRSAGRALSPDAAITEALAVTPPSARGEGPPPTPL